MPLEDSNHRDGSTHGNDEERAGSTDHAEISVPEFLFIGSLEVILNQALARSPSLQKQLEPLCGSIIRVRTLYPSTRFFMLVCEDGVEISNKLSGKPDVSITATMGSLVYNILSPESFGTLENSRIKISGNRELVERLGILIRDFDIISGFQQWARDIVGMDEFSSLFQEHDPIWALRLQDLPKQVDHISRKVSEQSVTQQEMLREIRSLKESLRSERRTDIISITIGTSLFLASIGTATGALPIFSIHDLNGPGQTLILAATGLTLMLSRLFGKRYGK